jgi:hypothetical protein
MTKYNLVNPYIDGNLETSVKEKTELKAAKKIYEKILAPMFITSAPEFNFSIEGNGKLYHFTVHENVKGDNAKFKITKLNGKVDNNKLMNKIKELNDQTGGKHKRKHKDDDSSSSSSSESPYFYTISSYYYSPYVYVPYVTPITYTIPIITPSIVTPTTCYTLWL